MKRLLWLAIITAALQVTLVGCEKKETKAPPAKSEQAQNQEPQPDMSGTEKSTEAPMAQEQGMAAESEAEAPAATMSGTASEEGKADLVNVNEKIAEEAAAPMPEVPPTQITYPASMGDVTFDHAAHAGRLDCSDCHTTDPPQKIAIDKDVAHDMCKGCHQKREAGPTKCPDCHKK